MALQEMHKSKKNKKTLLIISDGGDNNSRYTVKEVKDLIQESDVLIYAIGVFGGGNTPEEAGGPGLLSHIAEQTGGRMFFANAAELPDVAKKIGIELRNRYILGLFARKPGARRQIPSRRRDRDSAPRPPQTASALAHGL